MFRGGQFKLLTPKATFIPNTDARPWTFSVRPSRQNRSYRPRSDTAVDVEQNGAHEAKKRSSCGGGGSARRVKQLHPTRRFSVHPIQRMRNVHGEYHHLLPELFEDSQKFVDYLRLQPTTFHDLLDQCAADLTMVVSVTLVINQSSRLDSNNQLFVVHLKEKKRKERQVITV